MAFLLCFGPLRACLVCELYLVDFPAINVNRYDIVVDATDNVPSRYMINDCCVVLRKVSRCFFMYYLERTKHADGLALLFLPFSAKKVLAHFLNF